MGEEQETNRQSDIATAAATALLNQPLSSSSRRISRTPFVVLGFPPQPDPETTHAWPCKA